MKSKNYKNIVFESNFGIITEGLNAGKSSYLENPQIKEVFIDGEWISNPGFDLQKVRKNKLSAVESKIIDVSIQLDKAIQLGLKNQEIDLNNKLEILYKKRDEINAL